MTLTRASTSKGIPASAWSMRLLVVVAGGVALWVAFKIHTGIVLEDAWITFRYAENVAAGRGFAYNPGEAVLGTSTPLLTLLLAAVALALGSAAIPTAATVLMMAASAGTAALIARLLVHSGRDARVALLAAGVFCVHPTTLWMTAGGMETPLVLLLMVWSLYAAAVHRWYAAASLAALLVLARPDGAVWAVLLCVFAMIQERGIRIGGPLAVAALILSAWIAFATAYFGTPLPHSIAAKHAIAHGGGDAPGMRVYVRWGLDAVGFSGRLSGIWLGAIGVEAVTILGRPTTGALTLLVYPVVLVAAYWVGRAPLEFPWYSVPVTLSALMLGVCGGARAVQAWYGAAATRRERVAITAAAAALVALFAGDLAIRDYQQFVSDRIDQENEVGLRQAVGEWLARTTPVDATVAVEAIGYTGTFSKRRIIDLAGLISPQVVAEYESSPSRGAAFEQMLVRLRPDYVVLRSFEVDFNEAYHGGRLFETPGQRTTFDRLYEEAARFSAPHAEAWGRLAHLTVYRRRSGSLGSTTRASSPDLVPALTGESIRGHSEELTCQRT